MKPRPPQLALRLDFNALDAGARWRDGARLTYLGADVALALDTRRSAASLEDGVLHLPLPPEATPRQIQDGAETWLRHEAQRVLSLSLAMQARARGRAIPRCSLSFAARGHWVQPDDRGGLRCHWRLIEQPIEVIEQTLGLAVARLPSEAEMPDLFACA